MLVLFTDFGVDDPYVGQLKARLCIEAAGVPVVDLLHRVPDYNAHAGAHLVAAFAPGFPPGSVFVCVVDPGVGTGRAGMVVAAGGRWFVGPDNGLLSVVAARATDAKLWRIDWRPDSLCATFHGRDVFAPVAARIARGEFPHDWLAAIVRPEVEFDAGDLARAIYIDHFGNVWTGLRAANLPHSTRVRAAGREFSHAETFGALGKGEGFWFVNSVGLLEIAVNRGNAAADFGLALGARIEIITPAGRLN